MGTWYLVSTVQWKHKIIEVLWFELCEWRYGGWLFMHCLKKGQHCEAGRQKLSILVDKKRCHKSIHLSLWWRGCQWRNESDQGEDL